MIYRIIIYVYIYISYIMIVLNISLLTAHFVESFDAQRLAEKLWSSHLGGSDEHCGEIQWEIYKR